MEIFALGRPLKRFRSGQVFAPLQIFILRLNVGQAQHLDYFLFRSKPCPKDLKLITDIQQFAALCFGVVFQCCIMRKFIKHVGAQLGFK